MLDEVGPHCHGTCQACHSPQTARRQQAEPTGLGRQTSLRHSEARQPPYRLSLTAYGVDGRVDKQHR